MVPILSTPLSIIVDARQFVPNKVIARDIMMATMKKEIKNYREKYAKRLGTHQKTTYFIDFKLGPMSHVIIIYNQNEKGKKNTGFFLFRF